jgi:hypothetical protein
MFLGEPVIRQVVLPKGFEPDGKGAGGVQKTSPLAVLGPVHRTGNKLRILIYASQTPEAKPFLPRLNATSLHSHECLGVTLKLGYPSPPSSGSASCPGAQVRLYKIGFVPHHRTSAALHAQKCTLSHTKRFPRPVLRGFHKKDFMATDKQLHANRANAQHSSGPSTEPGRKKVRFNALEHGVYATSAVIAGEDPAAFKLSLR